MCLAVPGKILSIEDSPIEYVKTGKVSFGGVVKEISLAYTPEAQVGDYVYVHVGFALSVVDEAEAEQVFKYLAQMGDLEELQVIDESVFTASAGVTEDSRS
jgi:hydrogenase expression/formation protein HypC